jgi:hypothetical protein
MGSAPEMECCQACAQAITLLWLQMTRLQVTFKCCQKDGKSIAHGRLKDLPLARDTKVCSFKLIDLAATRLPLSVAVQALSALCATLTARTAIAFLRELRGMLDTSELSLRAVWSTMSARHS